MYLTTKVLQTEKHHEVDLNILAHLCYHSARLYNVGLYSVRQHYFNTNINGSINILKKYLRECKSNVVITTDDIRVLLNAPCERLYVFPKAHKSLACG